MSKITDESVVSNQPQAAEERVSRPQTDREAHATPVSDDHPKFLAKLSATPPPEEIVSLPPEREAPIVPSPPSQRNIEEQNYKQVLSVVAIQIFLLINMMAVTVGYGWFHNVPDVLTIMVSGEGVEAYSEAIAR